MEDNKLQIKFDGESHQIDANTLINILIHYNTVIMAANREYGDGTKTINIQVHAPKAGSFIIDLSVVSNLVSALFSTGTVGYVADLISITQGVFSAYKTLKGRPAKSEEDKAKIRISGANITINNTIYNVYNSPATREAISKSIETAKADDNVAGICISSKANQDVSIPKEMFDELIYDGFENEDDALEERNIEDEQAILTITALSFKKGSNWSFIYKGFSIKMNVKDDALMSEIDKGIQFGKGDAIKVRLRITQRYNKEYKVYENKSYRIVEFYELIKARYETPVLRD